MGGTTERATIKIVVISDTHTGHEALGRLSGDVLVHCGDFALWGHSTRDDIANLDRWFSRQDFRLILVTGGNHDFDLEECTRAGGEAFHHATYLEDKRVEFEGLNFYGAPWVPELKQWAYFQEQPSLESKWATIPSDTDVLITHSPPSGILDVNTRGKSCGCPALRARLKELKLRLHCFGHVHASAGVFREGGTTYVNAAMVNHTYTIVRRPYEFEI